MYKRLLYVMAIITAMAACTEKDAIYEESDTPKEITFTTFANSVTRGGNVNSNGLEKHHKSFKVWANKIFDTDTIKVFDGSKVQYETNWNSNVTKYWDNASSKYIFFAAAPDSSGWSIDSTTFKRKDSLMIKFDNFKLTGVNLAKELGDSARFKPDTTWAGQKDIDLMIATNKQIARANDTYNQNTPASVSLEFNHILSRLNIMVKKGIGEKVTLDSIVVHNLKNKGNYSEYNSNIKKDSLNKGTTGRWNTLCVDGSYNLTSVAMDSLREGSYYVLESLVIPQCVGYDSIDINGYRAGSTTKLGATDSVYIRIGYKIAGEPFIGTYNLASVFGATKAKRAIPFNEGWQYNLTITIGSSNNEVKFDANVYEWTSGKAGTLDL